MSPKQNNNGCLHARAAVERCKMVNVDIKLFGQQRLLKNYKLFG